ncbi:MAG: FAD-dependent oxidoreductase, partial [Caldilineaceae bacterium]
MSPASNRKSTYNKESRVIICGGGVIGACIAYYLTVRGVETTVIERTGVANASSGKSGGFLALDWCRGTPVDALARRSFALHAELAATLKAELGLDWGYRPIETLSIMASQQRDLHHLSHGAPPEWLGPSTAVHSHIGDKRTTAQLDPFQFTQCMMRAAQAHGAQLRMGTVEGVAFTPDGRRVSGVLVDGEALAAENVVIALGPWSLLACNWLPLPQVYGLKGHSLIFRFEPNAPFALFAELEMADGQIETPEV